ncbi:DNA-processing protein DprA [Superficieibacter sp.]|uniref:DNA-processing protein DprA n=1 Tax=Superficieibacter sp. TaxID=2303322 RepID=UPI0028AFBF47|nr:DNA-processing protein DprA [Superficieibacter sp.]
MKTVSNDTQKLLAIKFLKGIGEKTISSLSTMRNFSEMSIHDILKLSLNKKDNYSITDINEASELAQQQINIADKNGHVIISFFDDSYSLNLKNAGYSAPILFCNGNIKCLSEDNLTIIGTREPTKHGEIIAEKITSWFVKKGWNIVSGLAFGVDSIAHSACIESNGKTISVLAHGLEKIYPAKNKDLAKRIVDKGGLLVSEYPYNSYVGRSNFVQRDTIQAAISTAVILIQTGIPGGSLHASRASLQFGRPLIVAGQSKSDIMNREDKAIGNDALINSSYEDIRKMLKINDFNKDLLLPLVNRNHYESIESKLRTMSKINCSPDNILNSNMDLNF